MQDKQGVLIDRREMLKVKVKALAEEARIIRKEERKLKGGDLRDELHRHRVFEVRSEARAAHLAYGFIRGRTLQQMETAAREPFPTDKVVRMCKKYGKSLAWETLVKAELDKARASEAWLNRGKVAA